MMRASHDLPGKYWFTVMCMGVGNSKQSIVVSEVCVEVSKGRQVKSFNPSRCCTRAKNQIRTKRHILEDISVKMSSRFINSVQSGGIEASSIDW